MRALHLIAALLLHPATGTGTGARAGATSTTTTTMTRRRVSSAFVPPEGAATTTICSNRKRPSPSRAAVTALSSSSGNGFGSPEEDMTPPSAVSSPRPPSRGSGSGGGGGGGEFEMQEMKFQIRAMLKRGIPSRALLPEKRDELASYVRETATRIPSPIAPGALADPGRLDGTVWRLAFSTEAATLGDLPREANVVLKFKDGGVKKVDYELEFTEKVWGLKRITAESSYTVDPGPLQPGLLTMVYDKITAGAFGTTIPVGLFGMLKGRANYVETVWFDGDFWIDRGFGLDGDEYFNVFVRDDEGTARTGEIL